MRSEILLSIIVPVYNVEKYIGRCIESILNQSYSNLQLILVDDGSTDRSGVICDLYAQDDRVNIIHIDNTGVSNARNIGLAQVKGDYVGFVDSDDWIDNNMYSHMISIAEENHSDIIQVEYMTVGQESYSHQNECSNSKYELVGQGDIICEYAKGKIHNCVWSKIFNFKLIADVRFDTKYSVGEDAKFVYECCKLANRVHISDYNGYYYYMRDDSVMAQNFQPKRMQYLEILVKQIDDNKANDCIRKALTKRINWECLDMLKRLATTQKWDEYAYLLRNYVIRYGMSSLLLNSISLKDKINTIFIMVAPELFHVVYKKRMKSMC